MRRILCLGMVVLSSAWGRATSAPERTGDETVPHPRLMVAPPSVEALRRAVRISGSPHAEAFAALRARVDLNQVPHWESAVMDLTRRWAHGRAFKAQGEAMAYLLTGEPRYARMAFETLREIHDKAGPQVALPERGPGLGRATTGLGFALAYDWCYGAWSAEQRGYMESKLLAALAAWETFSHSNLGDARGSNWAGICRGGELLVLLAAGLERRRAARYNLLKRELRLHLQNGYDELGVSGPTIFDEGWASLALATVPRDAMPHYVWWYDRALGIRSQRAVEHRYDWQRAGMTYMLLFYPTDVQASDPSGTIPCGVSGRSGQCYFRSRWRDADDVVISLTGDAHHHGHAWDQPEALQLGLFAHNTLFFGGPNKLREPRYYSTLLVDGANHAASNAAQGHTGTLETFEAGATGGYAVVGGGQKYRELGVESARRHLLADFRDPALAVLSTLDRVASPARHAYTWQANVGSHDDDWGIQTAAGREGGRPTFLLSAPNGAYVKGWVLHPADAAVTAGDPLQVATAGTNAAIWIVWVVGRGEPPVARVEGEGLQSRWRAGATQVDFSPADDRIRTVAIDR